MIKRLSPDLYDYMDWIGRSKNKEFLQVKLDKGGWEYYNSGSEKEVWINSTKNYPFVIKTALCLDDDDPDLYSFGVSREYRNWRRCPKDLKKHLARYYGKLYRTSSFELGFQERLDHYLNVISVRKEERKIATKIQHLLGLDLDFQRQAKRVKDRGIVFYDYGL